MSEFYEDTIATPTRKLFNKLATSPWLSDFYLAGGTALALQLGHRTSVDLDFFSEKNFDEAVVIEHLTTLGKLQILKRAPQSVIGTLDGVKFSFLGYMYPLLNTPLRFRSVNIASIEDIACMKLDALSSRGTKRDFIDVHFIASRISLSELLGLFNRKFASVGYNMVHIKKSLVFFDDAEDDPMPAMLVPANWGDIKDFFVNEVTSL